MAQAVLKEKSFAFALQIVRLSQNLQTQREFVLSKQILRSGTSIGAMIREAECAESRLDFIHKLSIALKEANETEFWILLLRDSFYLETELARYLLGHCKELMAMLTASIRTAKKQL